MKTLGMLSVFLSTLTVHAIDGSYFQSTVRVVESMRSFQVLSGGISFQSEELDIERLHRVSVTVDGRLVFELRGFDPDSFPQTMLEGEKHRVLYHGPRGTILLKPNGVVVGRLEFSGDRIPCAVSELRVQDPNPSRVRVVMSFGLAGDVREQGTLVHHREIDQSLWDPFSRSEVSSGQPVPNLFDLHKRMIPRAFFEDTACEKSIGPL